MDSKLAERVQQIEPEAPADQLLISNQELDDMESSITVEPPGVVPSNGSASKSDHLALPENVTRAGPGFTDQVGQLFKKIDTDSSGTLDRNEAAKAILFQTGKYMSDTELDQAMKEIDTDGSGDVDIEEFQAYMSKNHNLTLKEKTALAVAMDSKLAEQNGDTTKGFDKINVGSPLRSPRSFRWADQATAEDSAKSLSETAEANLVKRAVHIYNISKEGRELAELKKRMQGIVKLGQSKANGDAWSEETRPLIAPGGIQGATDRGFRGLT
jgi:hypothetical protein